MRATKYIKIKQYHFALNSPINLRSRKIDRGSPFYTEELDQNLFQPLPLEVIQQFNQADGNELRASSNGDLPKIQAVHSSAAIAINLFSYWLSNPLPIAIACKFCSPKNTSSLKMEFEAKVPISDTFERAPNLDVLFRIADNPQFRAFAIESKFSEPFNSRSHRGLNPAYLELDLWTELQHLKALATRLSPDDHEFRYLDAAQLIKHVLGLTRAFKQQFKLLYLYYDALSSDSARHEAEIDKFEQVAQQDKVEFRALSYQDLINNLANQHRTEHEAYIRYITARYL